MGLHTVVEVSSWNLVDGADPDFDLISDAGFGGMVLKVSQGMKWAAPYANRLARMATTNGLLLGALHYADLRTEDATEEAAMFLGSLPPADYSLGAILEVGELAGKDAFPVGEWIKRWCEVVESSGLEVALILPDRLLEESSTVPWGRRLITAGTFGGGLPAWAWVLEDEGRVDGLNGLLRAYRLKSLRGLNAPGAAVGEVARSPHDGTGDDGNDDSGDVGYVAEVEPLAGVEGTDGEWETTARPSRWEGLLPDPKGDPVN